MEYFIGEKMKKNVKIWQLVFLPSSSPFSIPSCRFILFYFHFIFAHEYDWSKMIYSIYGCVCVWHTARIVIFFIYLLCAQAFFPAYFIYWNGNVCLLKFSFSPVDTKRNKNLLFLHTHISHSYVFLLHISN